MTTEKTITIQQLEKLWKDTDTLISEDMNRLNNLYNSSNITKKEYEAEKAKSFMYYRGVTDFYKKTLEVLVNS